jgi:uncharacterized membrane protein (UPF0127 family)
MKDYRSFAIVSLVTLLLLTVSFVLTARNVHAPVVPIDAAAPLQFEIVRTPEAWSLGLGGRTSIPQGYGMLFVFPKEDRYSFWMKDMLVPIDIVWLSDNGTIVGIEESVLPETYPDTSFTAPEPVRLVLEMRAGESRARGYQIGDRVALPENWQK